MSIRNRLAALEGEHLLNAGSVSGASGELLKQLSAIAERMRDVPLNQVSATASPVEIAALIMDGRVDDNVARQCVVLSKRTGASAKLFQSLLEAAGCGEASLTEEG